LTGRRPLTFAGAGLAGGLRGGRSRGLTGAGSCTRTFSRAGAGGHCCTRSRAHSRSSTGPRAETSHLIALVNVGHVAFMYVGHAAAFMHVCDISLMHMPHTASATNVGGVSALVDHYSIRAAFVDDHSIRAALVDHDPGAVFVHHDPIGPAFMHHDPIRNGLMDHHSIRGLGDDHSIRARHIGHSRRSGLYDTRRLHNHGRVCRPAGRRRHDSHRRLDRRGSDAEQRLAMAQPIQIQAHQAPPVAFENQQRTAGMPAGQFAHFFALCIDHPELMEFSRLGRKIEIESNMEKLLHLVRRSGFVAAAHGVGPGNLRDVPGRGRGVGCKQ